MSRGEAVSTCGLRPSPLAPSNSAASELPLSGEKSRPTMRTSGSASVSGAITGAKASSITRAFTDASQQDVDLLGDRKTPVERHQQGAQPRAGVEQHQVVRVVGGKDGDAVAAADAELRFQGPRGFSDALRQARIAELRARKSYRRLVRRERSIAVDKIC